MIDARDSEVSLGSVGRSALILTVGAAAVQVIGIVRELFVAAQVGVSSELDALLIALVLPTSLSGLLTIGTVTALVPAYIEARTNRGRAEAQRLTGAILVWVGLAGLIVALGLASLAGWAIAITGPGLNPTDQAAAVGYLQLLAPVAFVAAVTGILYAICQAEERFAAIAWATLAGSVTTAGTLLLLWPQLRLGALALGNLIGPVVTVSLLLAALIRGSLVPRPTLSVRGLELGGFVRHAAPLTLSAVIGQFNVIADRAIASLLAPGAVSMLRYGEVLVRTPISAISPAWGSALYPALVRAAHGDSGGSLASATSRSLQYSIAVFVPLAAITAAVAPVAVEVAFARGAFASNDIDATARVVAAFAPLIVILMTSPVLAGAHNARRSGTILLAGGTLNAILNFALDVVFGAAIGVAGIALSSSVTSTIVVLFFLRRLKKSEPTFDLQKIGRTAMLATISSVPPALVIGFIAWSGAVPHGTAPGLAALGILGSTGLLGYIWLAGRLGLEEPRRLVAIGASGMARMTERIGLRR